MINVRALELKIRRAYGSRNWETGSIKVTHYLEVMANFEDGNLTVGGGATFPGDRIWAAQFHRVEAKYCDVREGTQSSLNQLKLLNVFDMRARKGKASAADIDVVD